MSAISEETRLRVRELSETQIEELIAFCEEVPDLIEQVLFAFTFSRRIHREFFRDEIATCEYEYRWAKLEVYRERTAKRLAELWRTAQLLRAVHPAGFDLPGLRRIRHAMPRRVGRYDDIPSGYDALTKIGDALHDEMVNLFDWLSGEIIVKRGSSGLAASTGTHPAHDSISRVGLPFNDELSPPYSMTEIAERLGYADRSFCKSSLEERGALIQLSRQRWQVRLQLVDRRSREQLIAEKIDTHSPPLARTRPHSSQVA